MQVSARGSGLDSDMLTHLLISPQMHKLMRIYFPKLAARAQRFANKAQAAYEK
jgi:hypothetical protein